MKIAHIGNTAGIGSILVEEQQRLGFDSTVFVFDNMTQQMFGGVKINYTSIIEKVFFFARLKFYDVWHYHYPYGSLNSFLQKNFRNRVFLKHYHGDDLRLSGKIDSDFCLVSTPDLLKYTPNGKWLPNPIDLGQINKTVVIKNDLENHISRKKGMKRIAHYPYYKNYGASSIDPYSMVLNNLEKGHKCEVFKIINLSQSQALKMMSSADILLGKIIPEIGWIGKTELEAMALGKPVIAYISDELYEKYRPPVYRTTKETLEKDLKDLMLDESIQKKLSVEGSAYVKKHHDSTFVSNQVLEYYNLIKESM